MTLAPVNYPTCFWTILKHEKIFYKFLRSDTFSIKLSINSKITPSELIALWCEDLRY